MTRPVITGHTHQPAHAPPAITKIAIGGARKNLSIVLTVTLGPPNVSAAQRRRLGAVRGCGWLGGSETESTHSSGWFFSSQTRNPAS